MKLKTLAFSILAAAALAGCDLPTPWKSASAPSPAAQAPAVAQNQSPANWVSIPALPVIQDAIVSMAPTFNGQRNPELIGYICALAAGQASQQQVNERLVGIGIDPAKIPPTGTDSFSLLVSGNKAGQTAACAAFQATEVLLPINPRDFMHEVVVAQSKPAAEEKSVKNGKPEPKAAEGQPHKTLELSSEILNRALPMRIAQARANADVFALIATQLARKPGLTVSEYREQARSLFVRLAPTYLDRLNQQMPPSSVKYQLERLDAGGLSFSSNVGTRYEYTPGNGLILTQNGQLWYGKGSLLGSAYRLRSAYFKADVAPLLSVGQP